MQSRLLHYLIAWIMLSFIQPDAHGTERVSISSNGAHGNSGSSLPSISGDGRFVAFSSAADNLVNGDTNGKGDLFVHDRISRETTRISVSSTGGESNNDSQRSAISNDGCIVAFDSRSNTLVLGDANQSFDVFVNYNDGLGSDCGTLSYFTHSIPYLLLDDS